MKETVKIIGLRLENHNTIKSVVLTPDILSKKLVLLTGNSGAGKSTLLDMMQEAITGKSAVQDKTKLENGYLSEVQLMDGDIKLYLGARVREVSRGENKGTPIFETFLYAKDNEGKEYTPIINGEKATAASYRKMLTTDLTFNMESLFTDNQTKHAALIKKLFSEDLKKLGVDELLKQLQQAKELRDYYRNECEAAGAFMVHFYEEGWTEKGLATLQPVDVEKINESITTAKIKRDRIINNVESEYELRVEKAKTEKQKRIGELYASLAMAKDAYNKSEQKAAEDYRKALDEYKKKEESRLSIYNDLNSVICNEFSNSFFDQKTIDALIRLRDKVQKIEIQEPKAVGVDAAIASNLEDAQKLYNEELATGEPTIEKGEADTVKVDEEIASLIKSKEEGEKINKTLQRYNLWKEWTEASLIYDTITNKIKALYAQVDTGVDGMKIVLDERDDSNAIWLMYNGAYDRDFFKNKEGEYRYIYRYSSFQRAIIGTILQAARLNLNNKVLRLAIIDDVAFNSEGLAVLSKICEDLNVQLITSRTVDYDKKTMAENEIIIEGGEVFFVGKDNEK